MVAFHHSLLVVSVGGITNIWQRNLFENVGWDTHIVQLLLWISNGSFAVMIFMVLSGWAVSKSLASLHGKWQEIVRYIIKRLRRLYPVYAVTTLIMSWWWWENTVPIILPNQSLWWGWWFQGQLTMNDFVKHLIFLSPGLSGVSWTMQMIILSSLLAPIIILFTLSTKPFDDVLMLINIILFSVVLHQEKYLLLAGFYVGLVITKYHIFWRKVIPHNHIFLMVVLLSLMSIRQVVVSRIAWIAEMAGATILINSILNQEILPILESNWILLMGKISYSFYLWHFLVLYRVTPYILTITGNTISGIILNAVICITITIPVAYLSSLILENNLLKYKVAGKDY